MLPALSDITSGFGSMLASTMDARDLSRSQLATGMNEIGKREGEDAQAQLELQREEAEAEIKRLEQAVKDAAELQKITSKEIRQWEKEEEPISPVALEALIEVLNQKQSMDAGIASELRRRAEAMNTALAANPKSKAAAADSFSELLQDVMDANRITRPDLAEAMAKIQPTELASQLDAARQSLAQLPENIAPKSYTITGRKGNDSSELQTITLQPGKMTAEHIHLLEAGAAPSADLYALLKQALAAKGELKDHETSDLDRTFAEKTQELSAPVIPTPVIMEAPKNAEVITVTPDAPSTFPSGLADKLGLRPVAHTERKAPPKTELADALGAYAKAYADVFIAYQLDPPPTEEGNERNGARTEVAQRALSIVGRLESAEPAEKQLHRKLVKQLRPMTLEPITSEVMDAVTSTGAKDRFQRLNAATVELRSHIMEHSRAGMDMNFAMEELQGWLSKHNIGPEELRRANGNQSLTEMLDPHELKRDTDIPDQMERTVARLRATRPDAFLEEGNNMPAEFMNFGKKADALQGYYNQQYSRFNSTLDDVMASRAAGRYAGAAS